MAQAEIVAEGLSQAHPGRRFKIIPIKTTGDRITSITELRRAGKGVFVKEIERALLRRKIDIAVHSVKDLPSELPEDLCLGAILERGDPSDVFISNTGTSLEDLPPGSKVGTSSLRRQAFLKRLKPDLDLVEMKGNLDTRLEKLANPKSKLSGIIVAAAGLQRLHAGNGLHVQSLPHEHVLPAPGQGAIGIEMRARDEWVRKLIEPLNHVPTAACIEAEREILKRLEGGCQIPLGTHAVASDDDLIRVTVALSTLDGSKVISETQTGTVEDPRTVAEALEMILNGRGAREILESIRHPRRGAKKKTARPKRKVKKKKKPKRKAKGRLGRRSQTKKAKGRLKRRR